MNAPRRSAPIALLLLIVLLGVGCGGDEPFGFEPESAGFEIDVPESWDEGSEDERATAEEASESVGVGDIETEALWYLGTTGQFDDNVNVISLPAPPTSASEYFGLERDQLEVATDRLDTGFELETLDGAPAATYRFTGLGTQSKLEFASVSAIKDDTVYTATLTAGSEPALEELLPSFESAIGSWSWVD